ncbi:nucleoside hydrolase [Hoeflea prorocentri]|uniref:Nucleoside hydrolase n=1 Tax=Hoeflea prorocentri TaxID=1922333 RepID=A0A9X3UP12_9HYPH|nr:nucleoside hydrolase [Hoeflea prorocentri]MCY6382774.1 nucleoside hydrolase [Hoeflea prorocentri]MDA5400574.1 nucleoside hydrolase [Hoeflea prorocentri]
MSEPIKIIIDTDPGQDDAVAILLALASDRLNVLGITAVAGNVPLALTEKNARKICELARKPGTRVYAGAKSPMERPLVTAEYVHGKSGLDGPQLPEPDMPLQPLHGVDFIVETLLAEPAGEVTICALGPLTNLALALQQAPQIAERVRQIVLMGGGFFEGGNVTPAAEFNIYVDPEAAKMVFASGIPIVMMPLDVTHKVLTTRSRLDVIGKLATPVSKAVVELLEFFERYDESKYGIEGGPLHDPTVIAWLLQPDLFSGRYCNVEIETQSPLTEGMTVVDWWQVTDRPHNALVIRDVDADGFFALLTDHLSRL